MRLELLFVPITKQRFTTLGDWLEYEPGKFRIIISNMPNWRHEFLVLVHELTEWAICQASDISTEACDRFDAVWEEKIKAGIQSPFEEAGFDRHCPYHRGHIWGSRMERVFCWLLGVNWREYELACANLIDQYDFCHYERSVVELEPDV